MERQHILSGMASIHVTVENAIALTSTLPFKKHDTLQDKAFLKPNLQVVPMRQTRHVESRWMKCATFYHSAQPVVHQHVAEFFKSSSSSDFFVAGSWFKRVAQLFSEDDPDYDAEKYWVSEFGRDIAIYQERIRTNVLEFLFSTKWLGRSQCNGPIVIIVFALASIAVTQHLESEVFPRLFMWAYGLNSVAQWRVEFKETLNNALTLVLKLGSTLDHHFYFHPDLVASNYDTYDDMDEEDC
jgi:hypothetical protein